MAMNERRAANVRLQAPLRQTAVSAASLTDHNRWSQALQCGTARGQHTDIDVGRVAIVGADVLDTLQARQAF